MTLTLLQGVVTIVCLEAMKARGLVDFPAFNLKTAAQVLPLSAVFIAYVVTSLVSLGRVNVPMFTALRRLTILFVMVEEYYLLGITPSRRVLLTVGVMTLGCGIAAWKDLTFDAVSYFYLFLTNLFTSLYTVYINKVKRDTGLSVFSMLYYNTATTFPALLALAWATGDLRAAWAFPGYASAAFEVNFVASIFLAFGLNVATFYCSSLNSARTLSVVGQLKNFAAFLLGLVLFDDYVYEPLNFLGLWTGFAGSVWYTVVTQEEKNAAGKAADAGGKGGGEEPTAFRLNAVPTPAAAGGAGGAGAAPAGALAPSAPGDGSGGGGDGRQSDAGVSSATARV